MKERENILLGIIAILLYFVQKIFVSVPLQIIGINYQGMNLAAKVAYLLGYELLFIIILIFIYHKIFKKDIIDYLKNFKQYFKKYIEYWALAFGLMIMSNLMITTLLPTAVATNQAAVNSIFDIAPLYIIVSAVLYAPIIEESIFRLSIRNIIKNDTLFIIVSGLSFGLLHVIGSYESLVDFVYVIPYSIPGFVFAYTLVKSKNIFVPIGLHMFHNGITMILQIILGVLV